jgi:hydrocephalus-inducing protein
LAPSALQIISISDVPFTYSLRIPGDGKLKDKEFEIEPARDVIDKKKKKDIRITFVPRSTKKYEMVMVVDIEGVGHDMYSIPIEAESEVP